MSAVNLLHITIKKSMQCSNGQHDMYSCTCNSKIVPIQSISILIMID